MPFPLVDVPRAESELWSCRDWLPQVRVRLRTALSRGCGCAPRRTQWEFFCPLLAFVVFRGLAPAPVEALLL
jgi:hypothetical protein